MDEQKAADDWSDSDDEKDTGNTGIKIETTVVNESDYNKKLEEKKEEEFDLGQIQAEESATVVEKPVEDKPAASKGADGISFGGIPKFLGSKGSGKPLNQALFPEIGGKVDAAAAAAEKQTSSSSGSSGFNRGGPPSFSGKGAGKNRFGDFKGTEAPSSSSSGPPMFGKGPIQF